MWTLTYSVQGSRRVEFIPTELLPQIAPLVEQGSAYREALREILTINARLLTMWRKQQRDKAAKRKRGTDRRSGT